MIQRPSAVGIWLCEDVIVEEKTRTATLIRHFDRLRVKTFPSRPVRFVANAVITDGLGPMELSFGLVRLDTLQEIYNRTWRVTITDPLAALPLRFRVESCVFPVPGRYEIGLRAEGELIAHCVLTVLQKEEGT